MGGYTILMFTEKETRAQRDQLHCNYFFYVHYFSIRLHISQGQGV